MFSSEEFTLEITLLVLSIVTVSWVVACSCKGRFGKGLEKRLTRSKGHWSLVFLPHLKSPAPFGYKLANLNSIEFCGLEGSEMNLKPFCKIIFPATTLPFDVKLLALSYSASGQAQLSATILSRPPP